jgi:hypothetical protein
VTQFEFAKGWKLLILQPWGWRYRSLTAEGQPTEESRTQLAFYYDKLKWAHPEAWFKTASLFAEGKEWPSVSELRASLQSLNPRYVPALTDRSKCKSEPPPPEAQAILDRIRKKVATPC